MKSRLSRDLSLILSEGQILKPGNLARMGEKNPWMEPAQSAALSRPNEA